MLRLYEKTGPLKRPCLGSFGCVDGGLHRRDDLWERCRGFIALDDAFGFADEPTHKGGQLDNDKQQGRIS